MGHTVIPEGYTSLLSLYETQKAISLLKRLFEDKLAGALHLHRVSAPLRIRRRRRAVREDRPRWQEILAGDKANGGSHYQGR